jgi:16S rRNA (cytidine1402-2'-O)-methyltransferase
MPADDKPLAPGLYLVATPIGNLEDITLRALRVLRLADKIACEDTRQTQKLLHHFGLTTPTISYHLFNEADRSEELVASLKAGARIAVVSDAGTPGIADPGAQIAAAAIRAGVPVYPVPGANAAISALIASGLSAESFRFHGFLPSKPGARKTALEGLPRVSADERPATEIFYETPHRILETLEEMSAIFGADQPVVVARELTKLHEEFLRGSVAEVRETLAARAQVRGEFVLLFAPLPRAGIASPQTIREAVTTVMREQGLAEMEALKRIARERGIGKSEAYRELQRQQNKTR